MSVIWSKVWYDLWHMKGRTFLAVLSIAVGVFAVGAIFGMNDQLLSGMDRDHAASSPSQINMGLNKRIDRDAALSLRGVKGVDDVEPYNQIVVQYKFHPEDEWKQGVVDMRDDFEHQKYDIFVLQAGHWPGKDEIGIERLSSENWNVRPGDRVIVKVDNSERAFSVSGVVRGAMVLPPSLGGTAQFMMSGAGITRFGVPEGEFVAVRVGVPDYSEANAKEVATRLRARLAKQDVGVGATMIQDPKKHWGRPMIEGFTVVLEIMAVVSLLASVVLVFNTLTTIITQQTNQIGIIKAIGGTTGTIVKIYLAGVLIYGVLALTIALPLGTSVAFTMTQSFLAMFNIDYKGFRVSTLAVALQIASAVVVPLCVGLWPILSGSTMTVREAIASYGLGGDFGSSAFDRAVERIGARLLPSHYAIALGNMFRRKGRLVLTQLVLVTAGTMFLVVMALSASVGYTLDNDFKDRRYDTRITFEENQRVDRAIAVARGVPGVEKAEVWYSHSATILRDGRKAKTAGLGGSLHGIPDGSDFYKPRIVAGRWLQAGDGRALVMSKETADQNNIRIGDSVTLDLAEQGKSDWQVVGLYQVIFGGSGFGLDLMYAPQDAIFEAIRTYNLGGTVDVRLQTHSEAYAVEVTSRLKDEYDARHMKVLMTQTQYESRRSSGGGIDIVVAMLMSVAIIVALVGGIGLMGSLSISVVERTKEIGVMRAVGARSTTIMGMFVMEGILQGLLSWAVSVPLSFFAGQPLARQLGQVMFDANLDYRYDFQALFMWLTIILVVSILASILPARSATRVSVRTSLAYA